MMIKLILQNISNLKSNKNIAFLVLLYIVSLCNINTAFANTGVNPQIPYSGTVVKNDGTVLDGTSFQAKFIIYNSQALSDLANIIHQEIRTIEIRDGKFEVLLGETTPIDISKLNDDSLWLELQLNIDTLNPDYEEIFSPRRRIGSALSAINSMRLVANGGVSTNNLSLNSSGDLVFTGNTSLERMRVLGTGNVGIGTASPSQRLQITGGNLLLDIAASGVAGQLQLRNPANTFQTNIQAGAQTANITYTLPSTAPTINGQLLSSTTAGVMSWLTLDTTTLWSLSGNASADAWNGTTGSILGTTSAQPLVLATTNATAQDIRFFTGANGANERMRILGNGNIGIGTIAPNAKLNINTDSLGATVSDTSGISLTNSTVAISGTQQISPALRWSGSGFATTPGAARNTSFISYLQPVQGTTDPSSNLIFASSINNSAYTTRLTLSSAGALTVGAGLSATTGAFSSTLTNTRNALVTTSTDGIITTNFTASTAVVPVQVSPRIRLSGTAWNTTATASSNTINWSIENVPISGAIPSSSLRFNFDRNGTGYSNVFSLLSGGNLGLGVLNPTARLNLAAGTASANTSPLKFTAGTNLTASEAGAMEWNGTNLFLTTSGNVRQTINQGLTSTATLDFPSTNNDSFDNLTVTVTGALDGDVVTLGIPNASVPAANSNFTAWVSDANIVTIRFNNNSGVSQDPASGSFKVFVTKF